MKRIVDFGGNLTYTVKAETTRTCDKLFPTGLHAMRGQVEESAAGKKIILYPQPTALKLGDPRQERPEKL